MTWADFYLVCFIAGFFLSVIVFLAGGLRTENVREAYAAVRPFGLDLCSGVRTNGDLDEVKLRAFFQALNPPSTHNT